jgi:hypothetical protein
VPSLDDLRSLPASTLQRALSDSGIDHRHCIEKAELAAKVYDRFPDLPLAVRSEITSLVHVPRNELARVDVHQALLARITRLQPDEQYSVNLFQVCWISDELILLWMCMSLWRDPDGVHA